MSPFFVGAEFRDTYGDTEHHLNRRHVRLLSVEPDGRWLCQSFRVQSTGAVVDGPRSRISEKTLAKAYVPRKQGGAS